MEGIKKEPEKKSSGSFAVRMGNQGSALQEVGLK
jgi:hypothetical protein